MNRRERILVFIFFFSGIFCCFCGEGWSQTLDKKENLPPAIKKIKGILLNSFSSREEWEFEPGTLLGSCTKTEAAGVVALNCEMKNTQIKVMNSLGEIWKFSLDKLLFTEHIRKGTKEIKQQYRYQSKNPVTWQERAGKGTLRSMIRVSLSLSSLEPELVRGSLELVDYGVSYPIHGQF